MTWTKISDDFTEDPRMLALTRDDRLLLIEATVYCNRVLSDGYIPTGAVRIFTDHPDAHDGLERLVASGHLERSEDGWQVVDFHDSQPKRKDILKRRADSQLRTKNWREKQKQLAELGKKEGDSVGNAVTNSVGNALPDPTRPVGEGRGEALPASPLQKALTALEPLRRFGTIEVDSEDESDFEIDADPLLIQGSCESGRLTNLWAFIPAPDTDPTPPATLQAFTRHRTLEGQFGVGFEGDLTPHIPAIADYLQHLTGGTP